MESSHKNKGDRVRTAGNQNREIIFCCTWTLGEQKHQLEINPQSSGSIPCFCGVSVASAVAGILGFHVWVLNFVCVYPGGGGGGN